MSNDLHYVHRSPQVVEHAGDEDVQNEVRDNRCFCSNIEYLQECDVSFSQIVVLKLCGQILSCCETARYEFERLRRLKERRVDDDNLYDIAWIVS